MSRRFLIAGFIACSSACTKANDIPVQVPAEVDRVALFVEGDTPKGSGIFAWEAGAGFPVITPDDSTTLVVGFSAADLETVNAPDERTLQQSRVSLAAGCAPELPNPRWAARIQDSVLEPMPAADAPKLTTDWLDASCPGVPEGLIVDTECASAPCEAKVRKTGDCTIEVDLSSCGQGTVVGAVRPDGSVCLDSAALPWSCTEEEPKAPALGSYACARPAACQVQVYPGVSPAPFDIETFPLDAEAPYVHPDVLSQGRLLADAVHQGKVHDFAILNDRIVVTSVRGVSGDFCPLATEAPPQLSFLDPETLAVTSTRTGRRCMERITPDLQQFGYYGVYADDADRIYLGHFSADGGEFRRVPIDARGASMSTHRVVSVDVVGDPRTVVVILMWRARLERVGFQIHRFSAADLTYVQNPWVAAAADVYTTAKFNEDLVVGADQAGKLAGWIGIDRTGINTIVELIQPPLPESNEYTGIAVHPRTNRVVISTSWQTPAVHVAHMTNGAIGVTRPFEGNVIPGLGHMWSDTRMLMTGSVFTPNGVEAVASLFDPVEVRYLPGTWPIGQGVVKRILTDSQGRLLLLMPWTSALVRLTPK